MLAVADLGGGGADPAYAPLKFAKKVEQKVEKKKYIVEICSMKLCSRDTRECSSETLNFNFN